MVVAIVALLILILGAILFPGFVKGLLYTVLVVVPGALVILWVGSTAPLEYVVLFTVAVTVIVFMCVLRIIPWS